ncbi:tannase/feruloyl esterase family alpha/beta hydrolase [Rhizobium paknamense]|uniref:Feruloyl esterase n=1 Tax=Rhizobium paknamense TaxID=1206817 RepID=A0ABU0I6G3_9HYPH|nr:tannase/feruloyl esterase family alpha/beta hydrolase [Rhizobium paknamense]MDQ0453812.1 feruloyl esterase [Rhizobium paknamense]
MLKSMTGAALLSLAFPCLSYAATCEDIAAEGNHPKGMTITTAQSKPQGDADTKIAYCLVQGQVAPHQGIDGRAYAIHFEMRLPDQWNDRFVHQFNGGNDGKVLPATGPLLGGNKADTALSRGYAVVSSDAGHDEKAFADKGLAGGAAFGFDPQARSDYGYGAVEKLNPLAMALVEQYYGKKIAYRYGIGGSNGGRHGLMAATRLPDQFDGILVGYPGMNLPRAAIQHAWDVQSWSSVDNDITKAFSPADMALLAKAIVKACDKLDGREDGLVGDAAACQKQFNISSLQCSGDKTADCLSKPQIDALRKSHAGPSDSKGKALYSSWIWDPGMASRNWRGWKLESQVAPWQNKPIIAVMGAASLSQVFTTPPTDPGKDPDSLIAYLRSFDFDKDAPKIDAKTDVFKESAVDFMIPPGTDNPRLSAFAKAGHKMIVFHGNADPVFSVVDTERWYDRLNRNHHGKAGEFVRFYAIPGMPHGAGGPSYDDFDFFSPLVDWVEKGKAPEGVKATKTAGNAEAAALSAPDYLYCPYPKVARPKGKSADAGLACR